MYITGDQTACVKKPSFIKRFDDRSRNKVLGMGREENLSLLTSHSKSVWSVFALCLPQFVQSLLIVYTNCTLSTTSALKDVQERRHDFIDSINPP